MGRKDCRLRRKARADPAAGLRPALAATPPRRALHGARFAARASSDRVALRPGLMLAEKRTRTWTPDGQARDFRCSDRTPGPAFDFRRVLITGGAGFIGSYLADALVALGCETAVLDDLST